MKIFRLPHLAELDKDGAFCLSRKELSTSSLYIHYFRLRPKEGRAVKTPLGCEEVVYSIKCPVTVKCGKSRFTLSPGEAFRPDAGLEVTIENPNNAEAAYLVIGSAVKDLGPGIDEEAKAPEGAVSRGAQADDQGKADEPLTAEDEFEISREDEDKGIEDAGDKELVKG